MKRTKFKQSERRKEQRKKNWALFKAIKPKVIYFGKQPDMEKYFIYMPKDQLRELPSAALAVYPVFCCKSNFNESEEDDWFHISYENVAEYAGISRLTAIKGIEQLMKAELLQRRPYNIKSVHTYEYRALFYRGKEIAEGVKDQNLFQFYHFIIMHGVWRKLTNDAKRMYIILRNLATFDQEIYFNFESGEDWEEWDPWGTGYPTRMWDLLYMIDKANLIKHLKKELGINSAVTLNDIFVELINEQLVEEIELNHPRDAYKIWLTSWRPGMEHEVYDDWEFDAE